MFDTIAAISTGNINQPISIIKVSGPEAFNIIKKIYSGKQGKNKTITYGRIVVEYKPNKLEKHRTRLTAGGDRITYNYPKNTPTKEFTTIKLLLNSVISTPNARLITSDISNFYLNTKLTSPEYMQIPLHIIPESIVEHYQLNSISSNNKVYIKIVNGMYGLPQAGMLAYLDLTQKLRKFNFSPSKLPPGLWTHQHKPISFSMVVDDFWIKYINVEDSHWRETDNSQIA